MKKRKHKPFLPKDGSEDPYTLLIPLQGFKLSHHVYHKSKDDKPNSGFIGRDELISQIYNLLKNTSKSRGSYLIAGYRGSGKTSLINRVIELYEKEKQETKEPSIVTVRVNLGHDAVLDTRNLLFNIISLLQNEVSAFQEKGVKAWLSIGRDFLALIILLILGVVFFNIESFFNIKSEVVRNVEYFLVTSVSDLFSYLSVLDYPIFFPLLFLLVIYLLIPSYRVEWLKSHFFFRWRGLYKVFKGCNKRKLYSAIKKINSLHDKVEFSFEKEYGVTSLAKSGIGFRHKKIVPKMGEPQIELEFLSVLEKCREAGLDVIFIFDELDKISLTVTDDEDSKKAAFEGETIAERIHRRKQRIDSMLGGIKTLITEGEARFFFIAGRDMLDNYQAEKGSTSSLYESLFNHFFEVPSLLTDNSDNENMRLDSMIESYVCQQLMQPETALFFNKNGFSDKLLERDTSIEYVPYHLSSYYRYLHSEGIEEKDAKTIVFTLRQFISYLTIHSWGNCKRLNTLFESFTKPIGMAQDIHNATDWLPKRKDTTYMLHFGAIERQRIALGSDLYTMFSHHLSRQFTGADKLVVSTMAALHYCLKFHRTAFSRHHLFRMMEILSIYSSPELNSIFETTLTQALWPYLRLIRNGLYRYRFYTWVEQEIRYISRVNDLESASFTFSLDSINDIKAHYREALTGVTKTYLISHKAPPPFGEIVL